MELDEPKTGDGPGLWAVMSSRKSVRDFSGKSISRGELSQLLWAADGSTEGWHRTAPSAGGLFPVETYVVVNSVEGVDSGIYHYDIKKHELVEVKKGDFGEALSRAALGQEQCATAAVVLVWTIVYDRTAREYGERSKRYVYMDAGHIAQNLLLAAEALGLGAVPMAAFTDGEMNRLFGVDGKKEFIAYMASVGKK